MVNYIVFSPLIRYNNNHICRCYVIWRARERGRVASPRLRQSINGDELYIFSTSKADERLLNLSEGTETGRTLEGRRADGGWRFADGQVYVAYVCNCVYLISVLPFKLSQYLRMFRNTRKNYLCNVNFVTLLS